MPIRIKNNKRTNRLIQLIIIVGDFAMLWVLLYYLIGTIPRLEGWDEEKGRAFWLVCTFAFAVAEYLFPSVIHERVVGANDKLIDRYMVRHFVKPGINGWAQVTGFRGETRELWQMQERVERDIWHIQHWSLWLDLHII